MGWVLIALGFIAGFLFILAFGRIEVASYYGKETVWSGVMIATGIGIILMDLAGYLFQKVASILRYHENK
ncbi:hypothetical protein JCR18_19800 (plasmid) [Acinetobacter baumannii]|nr:hypothetical protein JCR18_19800 [Acinetobacter baumannii]